MDAAVEQVNILANTHPIDFIIGVGDIAHKGTEIQCEAATEVLKKLKAPFYPVMGNEEQRTKIPERNKSYAHVPVYDYW